jgi:hypothetical protein
MTKLNAVVFLSFLLVCAPARALSLCGLALEAPEAWKETASVDAKGNCEITADGPGGEQLHAERRSGERARLFFEDHSSELLSAYETFVDPYFPGITKAFGCPKKYKISSTKEGSGGKQKVFFAYFSHENRTAGACEATLVKYQTFSAALLCGSHAYTVRVHLKPGSKKAATWKKALQAMACPSP